MDVTNYAVVDQNNIVLNIVRWCGTTQWSPDPGHTAIRLGDDARVSTGMKYDPSADTWTSPPNGKMFEGDKLADIPVETVNISGVNLTAEQLAILQTVIASFKT